MTYYKATKMDGTDFHTGKIDYTRVPLPQMSGKGEFPGAGWLHLATVPTECVGASWPCRLFEIEPANGAITQMVDSHPHKIGVDSAYVVKEIESWQFFGPQGKEIVALLAKIKSLTPEQIKNLNAAWSAAGYAARSAAGYAARSAAGSAARSAAGYAAWSAAGYAARSAAGYAAWSAAGYAAGSAAGYAARSAAGYAAGSAAGYAAWAIVAHDLIGDKFTQEHYDLLTTPWRTTIGALHPDDADLMKPNYEVEIDNVYKALDVLKSSIVNNK
jgi:hypothetical protein